jgi:hypothetical protein
MKEEEKYKKAKAEGAAADAAATVAVGEGTALESADTTAVGVGEACEGETAVGAGEVGEGEKGAGEPRSAAMGESGANGGEVEGGEKKRKRKAPVRRDKVAEAEQAAQGMTIVKGATYEDLKRELEELYAKEAEEEREEYLLNPHGIKVYCRCASCKHCMPDIKGTKDDVRICLKGCGYVSTKDYCGSWEMRQHLNRVGRGGGRVLKKEYITYLAEAAAEWAEKHVSKPYTLAEMSEYLKMKKEAYLKLYGDKYMNI